MTSVSVNDITARHLDHLDSLGRRHAYQPNGRVGCKVGKGPSTFNFKGLEDPALATFQIYLTYLLTPLTTLFLEKVSFSQLVQEILRNLWNQLIHYRTHKSPPPVPIVSQINLVHALIPLTQKSILILSSHLGLGLPSGLFPSDFPTKILYTPLLSPIRAACTAHLIFLEFINQITFVEQYRSLSSSLCSFLHSPVTSSLLGLNILPNTLFSNTLSLCYSLNVSDRVS